MLHSEFKASLGYVRPCHERQEGMKREKEKGREKKKGERRKGKQKLKGGK